MSAAELTGPALAAEILKRIDHGRSEAFDMSHWFCAATDDAVLEPSAEPSCGTTMCAAGWAAHLYGWRLVYSETGVEMPDDEWRYQCAEKDGVIRSIEDVAQEALGLADHETFWYVGEIVAVAYLMKIAARTPKGVA